MSVSIEQIVSYAETLGMPEELLPDLAVVVVEQLPSQLMSIAEALASGDVTQVMKTSHTYKGSVATFTDTRIWEVAKAIEFGARQNVSIPELKQVYAELPALHDEFLRLMEALVSRGA